MSADTQRKHVMLFLPGRVLGLDPGSKCIVANYPCLEENLVSWGSGTEIPIPSKSTSRPHNEQLSSWNIRDYSGKWLIRIKMESQYSL
jgi:hypothetical protein